MREAAEHPDARALYWAVYADDTPVGFVMIADEVDSPDYVAHYLWKLLIDERHQRRGFGTATLDLIVEYFRGRPGVEVLTTSAGQGDGSPIAFYERYGFERTGEVVRRRGAAAAEAGRSVVATRAGAPLTTHPSAARPPAARRPGRGPWFAKATNRRW